MSYKSLFVSFEAKNNPDREREKERKRERDR
jgi:hypothetical protein